MVRCYQRGSAGEDGAVVPSHRGTPDRERLRKIIGAVDARLPVNALEYLSTTATPAQVGTGPGYKVFAVRWPVFAGVTGAGLLFQPDSPPIARVVALLDPDSQRPRCAPESRHGWRRMAARCSVPILIDRAQRLVRQSGDRQDDQSAASRVHLSHGIRSGTAHHRLRGAEDPGGCGLVRAGEAGSDHVPVGVAGNGEGGLIAFYSCRARSAHRCRAGERIFRARARSYGRSRFIATSGACCGYFGDAEIAGLIAPRKLIVETGTRRRVPGPPAVAKGRTRRHAERRASPRPPSMQVRIRSSRVRI